MRVLLIEEDSRQGKAISTGLEQQGAVVEWLQNAAAAEQAVVNGHYEVVVLPETLDKYDGMALLHKLRAGHGPLPAIVMATRDSCAERLAKLAGSADDFIIKPVDVRELGARLRLLLGRSPAGDAHATLKLDATARTVMLDEKPIELTAREFGILRHLLEYRGQVISKQQLQSALYSAGDEIESNTVEVHVHHLRRKLGRQVIKTMHGMGYMVDEPSRGG